MAKKGSGPFTEADLVRVLHDGETIVGQGHASIPPPPSTTGRRITSIWPTTFVEQWLADRLETACEAERVTNETFGTSFPLDRNMAVVVTSERILTWSMSCRPGDPATLLADVPLWQIQSITTDDLPLGPRKEVQITMQDGLIVVMRVDSVLANLLVTRIRHRPG